MKKSTASRWDPTGLLSGGARDGLLNTDREEEVDPVAETRADSRKIINSSNNSALGLVGVQGTGAMTTQEMQ